MFNLNEGLAASPPLPLAGEGRGEGRTTCSTLTLPSLARRAPPSLTAWARGFGAAIALLALLLLAPAARAVEIQEVVSPGGIKAWLVEDHSNPLIALSVAFRGGAAGDPKGKEGLALMVSALLDEGAGTLDSAAFQGREADLAVDLGFDSDLDSFGGQFRVLTDRRDAGFELLRLALTAPRFDAPAVERIRGQLIAGLAAEADDPARIADLAWWRAAFPEHPYGRPADGTPQSLAAITPEDLHRFVAEHFGRNNMVLGVVGDIDAKTLGPLLDRTFGGLPARVSPPVVADTSPAGAGRLVVIDRDVPQSVVSFGTAGVKLDDPDYYAAAIVDYILGSGGFASRLTREVREKRGLAYSIDSYLDPLDHAGLLLGTFGTQNARVAESIDVVRQVWKRMGEEGPTAQELADAKTYLIGSYPLRLTSTLRVAQMLTGQQLAGLPHDYVSHRADYFNRVTLEDARRVARRLLDPAALSLVVVGRPTGLATTAAPAGNPG
jgi:zinc protease